MTTPQGDRQEEKIADEELVDEETEAAAAEAGELGGDVPQEDDDPALAPLAEAGEGESEGFELAEKQLEDIAAHGDEHRFPDRDAPAAEEGGAEAEYGEADETIPPDN